MAVNYHHSSIDYDNQLVHTADFTFVRKLHAEYCVSPWLLCNSAANVHTPHAIFEQKWNLLFSVYCSKIHSELGKLNTFTELCFTLSYLIDIHQLGVADDFKSLLFELFVCTDFSNGFSHQEQYHLQLIFVYIIFVFQTKFWLSKLLCINSSLIIIKKKVHKQVKKKVSNETKRM